MQKAIHALKYQGKWAIARPLGERLAVVLADSGWQPDLITATPLHPARLQKRGYNQSAKLAEQLARRAGLPFREGAVQRTRDTRAQVGLNAAARLRNVSGAFVAQPGIVAGKGVLLIDDVYTTGATLIACAEALREAGAARVWALTAASTALRRPV